MARRFILTVRDGPRVQRSAHAELGEALDALEVRVSELEATVRRETVDLQVRRFEPINQVAARAEIGGPGRWRPAVRAGVDIRGDGSVEAYLGQANREAVPQRDRESPVAALRRALRDTGQLTA
jgi:hypothetical protein